MEYLSHYDSPLGRITLAGDCDALTGLWFDGQKYFASTIAPGAEEHHGLEVFRQARRWLDVYFSGREPDFLPQLSMRGSVFRMAVWRHLLTIPYGCVVTYGEIAARVACELGVSSMSAQAVGGAVGHNPISLIVPCHRVVGASGSLMGYAGGVDRKRRLLEMERACRR